MYLSKDRKDQESSRNYVTWGMAEGSEDVYFGRRIKGIQNHFKHEEQLFFGGRNILLSSFRGHGVGTRLESIWRRAGINKVKYILRIMTALHGIWYPLCESCPCQWMAWSRVAGKMYPKPGRLYPQCSWVSRSIWMQRNEGENQNKGAALFPQMTVYLFVFSTKFFFSQVAKGMSWTGMKKIFSHIICFDNIILGSENKK